MADIAAIAESIKGLTLMEAADLVKKLEDDLGVSAAAAVAAMPVAGAAGAEEEPEEQTEFTVVLKNFGKQKIKVIKTVREITGLGLKEAKDLVDQSPKPVKENVPKEEAEQVRDKLTAVGAEVEVQ